MSNVKNVLQILNVLKTAKFWLLAYSEWKLGHKAIARKVTGSAARYSLLNNLILHDVYSLLGLKLQTGSHNKIAPQ